MNKGLNIMRAVCLLLLAAVGLGGCQTPENSADPARGGFAAQVVFDHAEHPDSNYSGTLAADTTGSRFRIEIDLGAEEDSAVEVIVNHRANKSWVVAAAQRSFFEMPHELGVAAARLLTGLVSDAPCWEYRRAERRGPQSIEDRPTVKWRCTEPKGTFVAQAETRWHDPAIGANLLSEDDEGARLQLRRIVAGPQRAGLFVPPANFKELKREPIPGVAELRFRLLSGTFSEDDMETLFTLITAGDRES